MAIPETELRRIPGTGNSLFSKLFSYAKLNEMVRCEL